MLLPPTGAPVPQAAVAFDRLAQRLDPWLEGFVGMVSLDNIAIHASHELSGEAPEALSFSDKAPRPTVS